MKILVVGGAGYIGSVLVPLLLKEGYAVHVLENFLFSQTSLAECCIEPNFQITRGDCRDKHTLTKALKEGWIAGAGLDVFPQEPPPSDHPIFDCDNVVMTAHTSGWSPDRQVRLILGELVHVVGQHERKAALPGILAQP